MSPKGSNGFDSVRTNRVRLGEGESPSPAHALKPGASVGFYVRDLETVRQYHERHMGLLPVRSILEMMDSGILPTKRVRGWRRIATRRLVRSLSRVDLCGRFILPGTPKGSQGSKPESLRDFPQYVGVGRDVLAHGVGHDEPLYPSAGNPSAVRIIASNRPPINRDGPQFFHAIASPCGGGVA